MFSKGFSPPMRQKSSLCGKMFKSLPQMTTFDFPEDKTY